ncbi:MAG TPA: hypothetical protein VE987_04285 [Polyangiaceae bacterium]|nr:hypothetical protein [Polyangiaceae bacterium]
MATRKARTSRTVRQAAAGSWIALLAATTLGDAADTLSAEVHADGLSEGAFRLIVQSYDASDGQVPGRDARPIGSVQRAVTADELKRGVHVDLVELRERAGATSGAVSPLVVAWIEPGAPDLEFDGRTSRPAPGSVYGVVKRDARQDVVHISLDRTLAA